MLHRPPATLRPAFKIYSFRYDQVLMHTAHKKTATFIEKHLQHILRRLTSKFPDSSFPMWLRQGENDSPNDARYLRHETEGFKVNNC